MGVSDGPTIEAPTVEALRQTRESWAERRRQLRPVGLAMLAVVVYLAASKPPYVGVRGESLGLTIALAGFVIGMVGGRHLLLVRPSSWQWYLPCLAVLVLSSAFLVWLQPDGPGFVGFLGALVMVWMARVIPTRLGSVLLSGACVAMLLMAAFTSKEHDHSS